MMEVESPTQTLEREHTEQKPALRKLVAAVHDGVFHADDVFAVAALKRLYPDLEVIRTRDENLLQQADFRIDIGGKHNPESGDFDHHQPEGAGIRENGIPYASIGLIWKYYGERICQSEAIAERIDQRLIQLMDADDTGMTLPYQELEIRPYTISEIIAAMNPAWDDDEKDYDTAFEKAVELAATLLDTEIRKASGKVRAREIVREAYQQSNNPHYLILDHYCPWQEAAHEYEDLLYVVFPSPGGDWMVRSVPAEKNSYKNRRSLPASWAGLGAEELAELTGIKDAVFCHRSRFIAGARSKDGARKMAELAINMDR